MGAASRYWVGRTFREIRACPTCWLRLMGRKVVALAAGVEVPNHRSYAFAAREEVPLFRWLPVRWWLLLALTPLGLVALWRSDSRDAVAWGVTFALLHAVGVLAFFVNSRYRIPLWPFACAWAGVGVQQLVVYVRGKAWRRLVPALLAAVALGLASWSVSALLPLPGEGRDHFYRSMARQGRGLLDGSLSDARAAVAADAEDPAYRVQLGNVLLALDRPEEAVPELRAAVELDPRQQVSHNNLGVALEAAGEVEAARAAYRSALRQDPTYLAARVNLALLELSQGRIDDADAALEGAWLVGEPDARSLAAAGLVALAKGECAAGERLLAEARALDPEAVDAIESSVRSSGRWPAGVC
ncbi:MAG: tetratricopeptide repeat protein [Thermoanaerobaculia bacterium]